MRAPATSGWTFTDGSFDCGTPQVGSPPNELALTTSSDRCYYPIVIRSYRDKDTRAVAERRRVRGLPEDIQRRAQRKLMILNNATNLNDLRTPPGNRLEALSGDRDEQHKHSHQRPVADLLRLE